jgi:hypothetical protein
MFGAAAVPVNHVWHFWLAVPLAAVTVLVIVGTLVGYFFKVTKTRYPQK